MEATRTQVDGSAFTTATDLLDTRASFVFIFYFITVMKLLFGRGIETRKKGI